MVPEPAEPDDAEPAHPHRTALAESGRPRADRLWLDYFAGPPPYPANHLPPPCLGRHRTAPRQRRAAAAGARRRLRLLVRTPGLRPRTPTRPESLAAWFDLGAGCASDGRRCELGVDAGRRTAARHRRRAAAGSRIVRVSPARCPPAGATEFRCAGIRLRSEEHT